MTLKLAFAGALLAIGLITPALSAPQDNHWNQNQSRQHNNRGSWEMIGSRDVTYRTERDVIPAFGRARHQEIKLCVYGQAVRMMDFDVRFRNGTRQHVPVRNVIGPGQCTRNINLDGRQRDIASVSLVYKSAGRIPVRWPAGRATVKVFAR
jgi:hypothetical protein